jgi:hypothetical protein
LDPAGGAAEGSANGSITPQELVMFDPAAFGTLVIGLDANRADAAFGDREAIIVARSRRRLTVVRALAALLRRAADVLEPATLAEPAAR